MAEERGTVILSVPDTLEGAFAKPDDVTEPATLLATTGGINSDEIKDLILSTSKLRVRNGFCAIEYDCADWRAFSELLVAKAEGLEFYARTLDEYGTSGYFALCGDGKRFSFSYDEDGDMFEVEGYEAEVEEKIDEWLSLLPEDLKEQFPGFVGGDDDDPFPDWPTHPGFREDRDIDLTARRHSYECNRHRHTENNRLSRTVTFLAALCLVAACQPASQPTGTAITNVTVIDAVNGVRNNQTVVFDGDEIVSVGPGGAPADVVETIDGSGKYLIPGLWDFHVHLSYDERFTDDMPALFLSYGITSVRDTGGLMRKVLPIVEKMRAPGAVAPRVWFAGPLLDGNFVVYDGESRPEIGVRNASPDEARATVIKLKEQGVDFIKIYEMVSPSVFEAMVETAEELDLPIDSHVPLSMRAGTAGPPVDAIEHLRNIELDCASNAPELHETRLELLRNPDGLPGFDLRSSLHDLQRLPAIAAYDEARCDRVIDSLTSTTQVPTLRLTALNLAPPYAKPDWNEALSRIREDARIDWTASAAELAADPDPALTEFGDWARFLTGRMHERGVPIAAGTDTPIRLAIPGYSLHAELEQLVAAGLSPLEALRAATVRPAEFFGFENDIGTIDPGKRADLVLLEADPLLNIAHTRRISGVVSKGIFYKPAKLAAEAAGAGVE